MVPLVGENRSLVRRGLDEVRRARRPGIRALLEAAKCEPTQVDEGDLAFRLAPRINAAGRLYRADAGVELFLTEDEARAQEIAAELSRANSERRATEREVDAAAEAARRELPDELREAPGLVLAGEGWHPGVIGIVASRLVERHHRPVVVVSLDGEGGGRGSGRSIPGFDLLAGLEACAEHLEGFGGHRAAAGPAAAGGEPRRPSAPPSPRTPPPCSGRRSCGARERIDAMVGGAGLGLDLAEELQQLAPFGMGNPGVRLLVPSARVRDVRTMGEGKHARFSLHSGAHRALGVAFGRASLGVGEDDPVDAAVRLEVNRWNGSVEPRLVLRELYPHEPTIAAEAAEDEWWRRFEAELAADPAPERGRGFDRIAAENLDHARRARGGAAAQLGGGGGGGAGLRRRVGRCWRWSPARERRAGARGRAGRAGRRRGARGRARSLPRASSTSSSSTRRSSRTSSSWRRRGRATSTSPGARPSIASPCAMLAEQLARRETLIAAFRDLRDAGEAGGEELLAALRGSGRFPRSPVTAARCLRVLGELELVQGTADGGGGRVGVVSSEGTELERSPAYRAYGARHQEALRYLERRKNP